MLVVVSVFALHTKCCRVLYDCSIILMFKQKQTSLWLVCEDSESEPVAAARAAHLLRAADDRGRHPGASLDLLLQIYFSFNIFLPARREDGEGGENTA